MKLASILLMVCFSTQVMLQAQSVRTVYDSENQLGAYFSSPNGISYASYGARVNVTSNSAATQFEPTAVKASFTRFNFFSPADESSWPYFPYSKLRAYESQQVAAGKAPIFITATYAGRKRAVVLESSLGLVNNRPTTSSNSWEYAVNLGDDRYLRFWIQQFIRPTYSSKVSATPNMWYALDYGIFSPAIFGVLDDNNQFVANVTWDSPFPQSGDQYMQSAATFFSHLAQFAPDIKVMPDSGSVYDWSQFANTYASIPGLIHENMYDGSSPSSYTRQTRYSQYQSFSAYGAQGKVAIIRTLTNPGDINGLRTAFAIYSLLKGPNFFFGPADTNDNQIPLSQYQQMMALLGNPTATFVAQQQSGEPTGFNLYSRTYDGGIVYLNYSGSTRVVTLPGTYYDVNGNAVKQISIADGTGTYVSLVHGPRVPQPRINPRFGTTVTGPYQVTITCDEPAALIRYTLDGSTPNGNSPIYNGPIDLTSNTTIRAGATLNGYATSALSTAVYTVSESQPSVEFAATSDQGQTGTAYPVLSLSAVSNGAVSVRYSVAINGQTTTTGTATVLANGTYGYFSVPVSGSTGAVATVSLTGASGAYLGQNTRYQYTIQ